MRIFDLGKLLVKVEDNVNAKFVDGCGFQTLFISNIDNASIVMLQSKNDKVRIDSRIIDSDGSYIDSFNGKDNFDLNDHLNLMPNGVKIYMRPEDINNAFI